MRAAHVKPRSGGRSQNAVSAQANFGEAEVKRVEASGRSQDRATQPFARAVDLFSVSLAEVKRGLAEWLQLALST